MYWVACTKTQDFQRRASLNRGKSVGAQEGMEDPDLVCAPVPAQGTGAAFRCLFTHPPQLFISTVYPPKSNLHYMGIFMCGDI